MTARARGRRKLAASRVEEEHRHRVPFALSRRGGDHVAVTRVFLKSARDTRVCLINLRRFALLAKMSAGDVKPNIAAEGFSLKCVAALLLRGGCIMASARITATSKAARARASATARVPRSRCARHRAPHPLSLSPAG